MKMEVNPNTAHSDARRRVLKLIDKRDMIDKELADLGKILRTNNTNMAEPLVDADGFPRQDIDVYQVRHARHRIICLMNDYKAIMKQIDEGLEIVARLTDSDIASGVLPLQPRENCVPIARVSFVSPHSPAERAGLIAEDLIVEFGSVNSTNFKTLQDVAAVVNHSVGQSINLQIIREKKRLSLSLTPGAWAGNGLVGCNILPLK